MLDGYVSEKEQLESMRKWWDENGKFLLIAVVLGLGIGFGWRYWHKFELRRDEAAAMVYQNILQAEAQGDTTTVDGGAKVLMKSFSGSPYASLGALISAKNAIAANKLSGALSIDEWVIKHSDQKRLQQMARISAARIFLAQKNPTQAMNELKIVEDKNFEPLIQWVKGDIDTQEGNAEEATKNYTDAKDALAEFPSAVNFMDKQIAQTIRSKHERSE